MKKVGHLEVNIDIQPFRNGPGPLNGNRVEINRRYIHSIMITNGVTQPANPASNFNFNGVLAAHDNFTISGNPKMSGAIIAENAKYTSDSYFFGNIDIGERNADHITMNQISGEPDIYGRVDPESENPVDPSDPNGAFLRGWREVIE